jgi:hypothetical protein
MKPRCVITTKESYRQGGISTALIYLYGGLDDTVRLGSGLGWGWPGKIELTSGSDSKHSKLGAHYGPRWEGLDASTKAFRNAESKRTFLVEWVSATEDRITNLSNDSPVEKEGKNGFTVVSEHVFGWLEDEGNDNEHLHVQVRKRKRVV